MATSYKIKTEIRQRSDRAKAAHESTEAGVKTTLQTFLNFRKWKFKDFLKDKYRVFLISRVLLFYNI
jgi:hypothetical protein